MSIGGLAAQASSRVIPPGDTTFKATNVLSLLRMVSDKTALGGLERSRRDATLDKSLSGCGDLRLL